MSEEARESLNQEIEAQVKAEESYFLPSKDLEEVAGNRIERVKKYNVQDPSKHEETSIVEEDANALPLSVQERRQTRQVYQVFKEKAKWGEFYRVYGIALFLLGGFFLIVPFYNVLCQTFGFSMR